MAATILAAGFTTTANASALENILSDAQYSVELRPRYEYVDQDGKETAKAPTVRTALGLKANLFETEGLNGEIQMINVSNFGSNGYFPEATSSYATIMDPSQTRVTQANISYSASDTTLIVGRKMVVLDNARFIGNVGWRQMPQTYDLGAVIYNGIENLSLLGAYVTRVHTVTQNGQFDTGSILLHATYKVIPELTLTVYDYMIEDFADHIGIRATGKVDLNGVKVAYEAEYAIQTDPTQEENSNNIKQDADYYKLGLSTTLDAFTVGVAYELLGEAGNGANEFYTPLATLHAMNGWADVFLRGTGSNVGLQDISLKVGYNAGEMGKVTAIYHSFQSDKDLNGYDDLGSELDIAYKYKINNNIGLLLKYADYSAGDSVFNKSDTTKYWVQLDYKFKSE
ncbi:hypothetical protein [Nitrosophilus labii]|uniref:hypothetical protein n=1 Tax=Nitrosophilus labii TaxID=2706014 RepID=UPI0016573BB8|nr:hypothetical protein [Nitrosophilus labii]